MREMKAGLPAGTIISVGMYFTYDYASFWLIILVIATPAGYWFLKGFEINKIAASLTYINMVCTS